MTTCRSGDHVIRDGRDRAANGGCRFCADRNSAKYRRTLRSARQRLAAIEAAMAL